MNLPPFQERTLDPVERQAHAWMRRIASGDMTRADGAALERWCKADPRHAAVLGAARRRWDQLRDAGELSLARSPAMWPATVATPPRPWQRRAFLAGAFGATAAASVAALVAPPLGLWPSADELRADFRTGTGEQRSVALSGDVSLQLNTRTSVAVWSATDGAPGIDLIGGEVAIDTRRAGRPFSVKAGAGRSVAEDSSFEVRRVAAGVCVTCLRGRVRVSHTTGSAVLNGQEQLTYGDASMGRVASVDAGQVSAWRQGFLRFSDTPLGDVVEEINRYRPGRVVLLGRELSAKAVTGRFQINALDKAIAQMQRSMGLEMRLLPGGVVLLSHA